MHIRRPSAIAAAAALAALTVAAGYFIPDPGSHPRSGAPPQSAVEPPGAQAFSDRAVRPDTPRQAVPAPVTEAASSPDATAPRTSPAAFFLDHRAVDPLAHDRYGNPPRRDLAPGELAQLASSYDLIDDNLRGQPDGVALTLSQMQEMRRINARLKIVRYLWTLSSNDVPLEAIEPGDNVHEAWFLRDAAGNFVRAYDDRPSWNGHVNYVLDPANTGVRLALGAQARMARRLGYDGVLLDDVIPYVAAPDAPYARHVLDAHPIDLATGAPYTDDAWRAAVAGLISRVRDVAGADTLIVIAGMGGSDELRAGGAELSALADVTLLQPFAADAASWLDDVDATTELAINGRDVIAYAPGVSASSPELRDRIDRYAFASYLLALEAAPAYYGQAAPDDAPPEGYATQPSYRLAPLGKPQRATPPGRRRRAPALRARHRHRQPGRRRARRPAARPLPRARRRRRRRPHRPRAARRCHTHQRSRTVATCAARFAARAFQPARSCVARHAPLIALQRA